VLLGRRGGSGGTAGSASTTTDTTQPPGQPAWEGEFGEERRLKAEETKGSTTKSQQASSSSSVVADYVPLFHGHTLAPMLEAGLSLVEQYAEQNGVEIVGYFHANELFDDRELGPLARRVANRVEKNCSGACILLLDSELARAGENAFALRGFVKDNHDRWEEKKGHFGLYKEETFDWEGLESFVDGHRFSLFDFDNHLDDTSRDWFNRSLLKGQK